MLHRNSAGRLNHSRKRRGVAAVELAVCMPFLVIILLGLWEVGRFLEVQQILENAVREGGRQASSGKRTNAEVTTYVLTYMQQAGLNVVDSKGNALTGVTVTVTNKTSGLDAASSNQLDQLEIFAEIPADKVRWLVAGRFIPNNANLNTTSTWLSMADIPLTVSTTIPGGPK